MITRTADKTSATAQFASDVQYYLQQQPRQLPSRYFYDDLGSALFDAICRLPWYGTRQRRWWNLSVPKTPSIGFAIAGESEHD